MTAGSTHPVAIGEQKQSKRSRKSGLCWGRTKTFQRCRIHPGPGKVFCRHHRWTPLFLSVFLVSLLGAIASIYSVYKPSENASKAIVGRGTIRRDLTAADVQVRLLVQAPWIFPSLDKLPREVHASAQLAEGFASFELVLIEDYQGGAGRGGRHGDARYVSKNLVLGGFSHPTSLDDLDGSTFELKLPQRLQFSDPALYYLDLYVGGMLFNGSPEMNGTIIIRLHTRRTGN